MNDGLTLSNGKTFYANCGIIGIDQDCEDIYEGYDGYVAGVKTLNENTEDFYHQPATREEMIEIADIMIKRWTEFKEKLKQ